MVLLTTADKDVGDNSTSLEKKLNQQYLKALEGFLMIIGVEGDIVYLSENVSKYLGLSQVSPAYVL